MVSIKIEVSGKKDIHRICLEDLPSEDQSKNGFNQLTEFVTKLFPTTSYSLKYKDDEGDLITIASENELKEALRIAESEKRCLRIFLQPHSPSKDIKIELPVTQKPNETNENTVQLEVQYQDKTETLILNKSDISLAQLRQKILSLFSELSDDFSLKYLDDESDAVTMTEDGELREAVQLVENGQVLVVVVAPFSKKERPCQEKKKKKPKKRSNGKMLRGTT